MVLTPVAEVINASYDDNTQKIILVTALKNVSEINAPESTSPGEAVNGQRWIRRITETFQGEDLEVHSRLLTDFGPGDDELLLEDVSRLPNSGFIFVNRGSSTEENLTYTGKDLTTSKLTGVQSPTNSHFVNELAFATVDIDFLGVFEVDLKPFGLTSLNRPPTRYGTLNVTLNDVITLRENIDFVVVNEFIGEACTRSRLRFQSGGQPNRFEDGDTLVVEYDYFDQQVGAVEINSGLDQTSFVNVYSTQDYEIAFGVLQDANREGPSRGNISITPPFSSTAFPPVPVRIVIPDVVLPTNLTITEEITIADNGPSGTVMVSDVSRLPDADILLNATDDAANRRIVVGGDEIFYDDIDTVNSRLVGVSGITTTHAADTEATFDGARFVRDVVKDAINRSDIKSQVDAVSVDVGGRHLKLVRKVADGSFNLQPGTYRLFFLGFDDDTDRGLHTEVQTTNPFENKDLTFSRYSRIIDRRELARSLLGATVSRRDELTATNPLDVSPNIP